MMCCTNNAEIFRKTFCFGAISFDHDAERVKITGGGLVNVANLVVAAQLRAPFLYLPRSLSARAWLPLQTAKLYTQTTFVMRLLIFAILIYKLYHFLSFFCGVKCFSSYNIFHLHLRIVSSPKFYTQKIHNYFSAPL